jgi:hypothetical protein
LSAEVAQIVLRVKKLDGYGMVRRGAIDTRGMDIAGSLQPDLTVRILLMNVWFSRNTDHDGLIADGDGNRVVIMPVHRNRIAGSDLHVKDIYVAIMQGKMVMGFVVHANELGGLDIGTLGHY